MWFYIPILTQWYRIINSAQHQSVENFKQEHGYEDGLTTILYEANRLVFKKDELVFNKKESKTQLRVIIELMWIFINLFEDPVHELNASFWTSCRSEILRYWVQTIWQLDRSNAELVKKIWSVIIQFHLGFGKVKITTSPIMIKFRHFKKFQKKEELFLYKASHSLVRSLTHQVFTFFCSLVQHSVSDLLLLKKGWLNRFICPKTQNVDPYKR